MTKPLHRRWKRWFIDRNNSRQPTDNFLDDHLAPFVFAQEAACRAKIERALGHKVAELLPLRAIVSASDSRDEIAFSLHPRHLSAEQWARLSEVPDLPLFRSGEMLRSM